jgi:hypothetical protein
VAKGTLLVRTNTSRASTPVVVHRTQLILTRDQRHAALAASQLAAIRSLLSVTKAGAR